MCNSLRKENHLFACGLIHRSKWQRLQNRNLKKLQNYKDHLNWTNGKTGAWLYGWNLLLSQRLPVYPSWQAQTKEFFVPRQTPLLLQSLGEQGVIGAVGSPFTVMQRCSDRLTWRPLTSAHWGRWWTFRKACRSCRGCTDRRAAPRCRCRLPGYCSRRHCTLPPWQAEPNSNLHCVFVIGCCRGADGSREQSVPTDASDSVLWQGNGLLSLAVHFKWLWAEGKGAKKAPYLLELPTTGFILARFSFESKKARATKLFLGTWKACTSSLQHCCFGLHIGKPTYAKPVTTTARLGVA